GPEERELPEAAAAKVIGGEHGDGVVIGGNRGQLDVAYEVAHVRCRQLRTQDPPLELGAVDLRDDAFDVPQLQGRHRLETPALRLDGVEPVARHGVRHDPAHHAAAV